MAAERGQMKKRLRWLLIAVVVTAVLAGIAYGASWLNARRYYLIVGPAAVDIGKGKMFPVGYDPFRPNDPTMRRAYEGFELPGGIKVARGTTMFTDRVELDQALFRLLSDAAQYAMAQDTGRAPELVEGYIERLRALPGVSIEQQVELQKLTRAADFSRGRQLIKGVIEDLQRAEASFHDAAGPDGPPDAEGWAQLVESVRRELTAGPSTRRVESAVSATRRPVTSDTPPVPAVASASTATTSTTTE